jgi:hypothetical protein
MTVIERNLDYLRAKYYHVIFEAKVRRDPTHAVVNAIHAKEAL